jgi:hypothetical protein
MIHQASFKGLILPQGEKQLKVPPVNTEYQVQVFDEGLKPIFKARLVGGGRLDVRARNAEAAKVLVEGLFKERLSEWQQV